MTFLKCVNSHMGHLKLDRPVLEYEKMFSAINNTLEIKRVRHAA